MGKNVYYRYNAETDNFERVYRSAGERVRKSMLYVIVTSLIATAVFFIWFYALGTPTERNLRLENQRLSSQYNVLRHRLDNSLEVMERIARRDDNFYRVMLQLEPVGRSERYAGADNENRYKHLQTLSDAELVTSVARKLDMLDRQLYAQSQSFDELRKTLIAQKDKMEHLPAILPLDMEHASIAGGFGYCADIIDGSNRLHEGIDFDVAAGTSVYATGEGRVIVAERKRGYGLCVDIDHGFGYVSRYAHLGEIAVAQGQEVKRGDVIGKVGTTGRSIGPHLHYEVRFKNEPQNPVYYFFMDITPEQFTQLSRMAEDAGQIMD